MLFLFVVFFTLADVAEAADNSIKPDQTNVFSTEGSNISLSCTYTGSDNSLHWYRQKPGSRPKFLLLIRESSEHVTEAQPPNPRLFIKLKKVQDKTSDSMADPIKPLFTHKVVDEGDDVTLSCSYKDFSGTVQNLQWYRQYPKSKPDFLLYIFENGDLSANIPPRMSAKVKDKQVDLIISSAAVSDSALYYCALAPTVTGNPAALYKNFHTVLLY
ncbi:hypothetical protein QTP86_015142 [Hemibagrus guttatus]|nr:hypothetical protein QTP86_015142 [Hemibagrus guttatus]